MSEPPKKTRILSAKNSASEITIRHITREKNGVVWLTHLVQGWKEDGKWKRRQFAERGEAERFAALKRVETENQGRSHKMVLSTLTEEQHEIARRAFDRLGNTYLLDDAIDYFLKNHRPPDFSIRLSEAIKLYIDEKQRDGLRARTTDNIEWTLGLFSKATDNPFVHDVSPSNVEGFLRTLRAKNGIDKASRRTWEIHRGALRGFFLWASTPNTASNRPFTFSNPVEEVRKFSARQVREEQAGTPATTSPEKTLRLMSVLVRWRGGVLVRPFALLYFAGIRPEELKRMAGRDKALLNLKTGVINIPANVSKTGHERKVSISANLAVWLQAFPGDIIPTNFEALNKKVRKHFELSHDEARHSFISFHVALHRSLGDAALQAGNSESIIRRHYLNLHPKAEGDEFFRIVPDPAKRRAVFSPLAKKFQAESQDQDYHDHE